MGVEHMLTKETIREIKKRIFDRAKGGEEDVSEIEDEVNAG